MHNEEKLARVWAEKMLLLKEIGAEHSKEREAAMEYILATTEPPKPPSMADVQWDHDEHFLAEADGGDGLKVVMLGMEGDYLRGFVTDSTDCYQKGYHSTGWRPETFIPTGRKFKLVPNEPEPLPEPEDCQPGDHYLVQLTGGDVVAAERRAPGAAYSWGVPDDCCMDEDITILARLTPDREVPNDGDL